MDATPLNLGQTRVFGGALPGSGRAGFGQASGNALSMRWSALHDAAAAVATLAGIAPEVISQDVREFPFVIRDAQGWRRDHAAQGVDDLAAIMEPGLSALLAVHARGGNASSAARALLDEFEAARNALLHLMPPAGSAGRQRRA